MNYLQYILIVSVCLGFFYAAYAVIFRKGINFRHARIYLIASIILSLLVPLSKYKIDTGVKWPAQKKQTVIVYANAATQPHTQLISTNYRLWERIKNSDPLSLIIKTYLVISALFILRIMFKLSLLAIKYKISYKVHLSDCVLLYNHGFRNTLSFFRWIFIQPDAAHEEDLEQIIAHEKIHVNQLHSFDILVIELLTAVMWFNPFVWMIRNSIQLVHEYLADDGALKTGINRFKYQALLINQIAEERLVILSSSFNHSLIKKRITMITKSKTQGKSLLKLLAILPVTTLIFLLTSAFNGVISEEANTGAGTFSIVNTNKVYPDVDNPPDTIIKKTIIKKISKDNPNDTIVTEKEEIITGEDAIYESETLRHSGPVKHVIVIDDDNEIRHVRDGERHEVRVHVSEGEGDLHRQGERKRHRESRYEVHVIDGDATVEEIEMIGDSVKHVKVIHGDDAKELSKDKKVIIRHSDRRDNSDILYIVDGKEFTDEEALKIIDPDQIESISVYKDENVSKHTDKDYEGVIVITTKKGKKK